MQRAIFDEAETCKTVLRVTVCCRWTLTLVTVQSPKRQADSGPTTDRNRKYEQTKSALRMTASDRTQHVYSEAR